jgi:predicted PurR-regulated permease PerM
MDERLESVRRRKRVVLLLVFLGIIAALIFLLRAVLAPFLIALFTAYLLDPVVQRMARIPLPRGLHLGRAGAIVIIYLVLLFCFYLAAVFTVPQVGSELQRARADLPKLKEAAEAVVQWASDWYTRVIEKKTGEKGEEKEEGVGEEEEAPGIPAPPRPARARIRLKGGGDMAGSIAAESETQVVLRMGPDFLPVDREKIERIDMVMAEDPRFDLLDLIRQNIEQFSIRLDQTLVLAIGVAKTAVKALYQIVLVMMITAFISIDRPRIVSFIHSVPPERQRQTWLRLADYLDRGLAGVIRGQLLICLVNGLLTWIGLQFLGVRYAILLGFVAGVFSLIPIFGTIISTIPIVLIAWATSGIKLGIVALGWILLIHFAEANFLNPKIMGSASKIHPVVVIFALIAGEHAYGIAGALLAVPTASILQSCFRFFVLDRQLEKEEPAEAALEVGVGTR